MADSDAPSQVEALCVFYDKLVNTPTITGLVPAARITNHRPQDDTYPAIRFRWEAVTDFDTKDSNGFDGRYVLDVWSKQHGDKEVLEIVDALIKALHNTPLNAASSGQSLLLRHRETRIFMDDGVSHHGVVVFTHIFTK